MDDDHDYYDYDYPPAKYPGREVFTMLVAVAMVSGLMWWLGWKVWQLVWNA
jgi:hypothetical protein